MSPGHNFLNVMKNLLFTIGALFLLIQCAPNSQNQVVAPADPTFKIVEAHAPVWELATTQLLEMADAMPEDMYGYRAHDSVRTFAEQIAHICGSSQVIANMFLKDIRPEGAPPAVDVAGITTDSLKAMIQSSMDATWDIMKTMNDGRTRDSSLFTTLREPSIATIRSETTLLKKWTSICSNASETVSPRKLQ